MTKTVDVGAELCRRLKDFTARLEAGEPLIDRQGDVSLRRDIMSHLQSLPPRGKTARLLREALTALDVANAIIADIPEWISVKDRLPETGEAVLFCLDEPVSDVSIGWWTGKWTSSPDAIVMDYGDEEGDWLPCSHWMPVPELPQ